MTITKIKQPSRPATLHQSLASHKPMSLPSPVFILSPSPRCGTNFLAQTLLLDPRFQTPSFLWEDHVLIHSNLLNKYALNTSTRWERESNNDEYRRRLLRHMGDGILTFLRENIEVDKQLLCKTPRAAGIENFFLLFPEVKLLVLIRDGRDVTESAVKTWPDRPFAFERSAYTWATGVRSIVDFMSGTNSKLRGSSWELVKYEDLVRQPEATMSKILPFLGVDRKSFDVSRINSMSLYGSSVHYGEKTKVHWGPVAKPKDFRPLEKWKSWSPWKRLIFRAIAGRELLELGYAAGGR